jgi:hypothetical protein
MTDVHSNSHIHDGALGHVVSSLPMEALETNSTHRHSAISKSNLYINSQHSSPGEPPWGSNPL